MITINNYRRLGCSQHRYDVDVKVFKGGEVGVTIPNDFLRQHQLNSEVMITGNLYNSDMVMAFFMTIDAIRRADPTARVHAKIPYLPYARQDRVCNEGEALSIAMFAKMLNAMSLESVMLIDPHSDVAGAVINNSRVVTQAHLLHRILTERLLDIKTDNLYLVAPDAGAVKKTKALSTMFVDREQLCGFFTASKTRNLLTQEISGTAVDGDVAGKNLLVVDDICDGGRTFIELGKILREKKCGELNLLVTHGIFSYGVLALLEIYDRVYTTDSFHPNEHSGFRIACDEETTVNGVGRFYWFKA